MTPQYRIEQYLNAINAAYLGDSPLPEYPSEPVWRIEQFLAAILSAAKGDSPVMACPDPVWHIEEFARAIYDALVGASPAWPCPTATNNIETILLAIYNVVADGTETDGIMTSWDIEKWLMDSYDAAKEGGGIEKTISGTMVHITDALAKAALSVLVNITPIQPGSGDPAPDNVRPISGRTGLSVYVSPTQDPDDATTYSVDWTSEAGTVYGGTLDVVTGLLTVDRATVTYNGTESWAKARGQNAFYTTLNAMERPSDNTYIGKITCDKLQTCIRYSYNDFASVESGITGYTGTGFVGQNWLYAKANGATTATAFRGWLSNNPIQVVYTLATPLTYQLTPQEVQMLLGENYVWSSSGDTVSVTYYAEGNANPLQSLNILLGGNYSNPKTADDVSDKEALEIILGGNK